MRRLLLKHPLASPSLLLGHSLSHTLPGNSFPFEPDPKVLHAAKTPGGMRNEGRAWLRSLEDLGVNSSFASCYVWLRRSLSVLICNMGTMTVLTPENDETANELRALECCLAFINTNYCEYLHLPSNTVSRRQENPCKFLGPETITQEP